MNEKQIEKQASLIKHGSVWDCIEFAFKVEGADIPALHARVMEIGTIDECWFFANNVEGADKAALQKRIAELEATK